jgi:SAM-dependent methyltransferase
MTAYAGRHAELYDVFYAEKPYAAEAAFVHERLAHCGRVLELACGTGTHALELEKLGHAVYAIDYTPEMIARARQKAAQRGSRVRFEVVDMRSLDLPERDFDAAICLFDAIGYVRMNDAILDVLRGVREHLRPGGLFLFEYWHAAAMLRGYEPRRTRRFPMAGGEIVRTSETTLAVAEQLAHVKYTIQEIAAGGTSTTFEETQTNRYFLVQEINVFLSAAGLEPLASYAGFDIAAPITEDTWHIVAVARRGTE